MTTGKDRSGLLALAALDVAGASLFALGLAGAIAALARGAGLTAAALAMLAGGVLALAPEFYLPMRRLAAAITRSSWARPRWPRWSR